MYEIAESSYMGTSCSKTELSTELALERHKKQQ